MAKLQFFCFCLVALLCSAESTTNGGINYYCDDTMWMDKCQTPVCLSTCLKKHPIKGTVAACTNVDACTCFYKCRDS
ncbi:hypothetical protein ACET3Z_016695 [Daucus carota]